MPLQSQLTLVWESRWYYDLIGCLHSFPVQGLGLAFEGSVGQTLVGTVHVRWEAASEMVCEAVKGMLVVPRRRGLRWLDNGGA